ncbi:MAG: sigma-70 family RNA polymerase sigma factor [Verrucomicrobia bacterium]|nr:MAG: sigma-70 family RNA polymerase sigma factor [Verrucomicrobiota bacterium]
MNASKTLAKTLPLTRERREEADADRLLIERVQAGEVAAFDVLVQRYRERIFSVIYNLTSNREDAADLTQETFIKAFQSINRFKKSSSFFTWLYRIAINNTLSHLRKHRLRRFFSLEKLTEDEHNKEVISALVDKCGSDKESLIKELQEKLNEAFQKLSFKHRTVLTLFEIDQLSHQEIAEIMDCSVGTVRSRLHYAKQQMQSYLQDYVR